MSHRRALTFALFALLLTALFATGCGGGDNDEAQSATFESETYPFSFDYPEGWKLTRNANFTYGSDSGAERAVSVALVNPYDQVTVTQYRLRRAVPAGENGNKRELDKLVAKLTKQSGGTSSEGKVVEVGGLPGYEYVIEFESEDARQLQNRVTFLFEGKDEIQINCQSTEEKRDELLAGCDEILSTFKFDG